MAVPESHVAGTAEFEAADNNLVKTLNFNHLLFLSVTALIGSGWLFAALASSSVAGPAAIVAWLVGGILVILIAFTYMEPAGMLPRSGAIVRYPALTHGSYTGWIMGWAYWLSAITVPAIEAEAVVTYVGGQFPTSGINTVSNGVTEMAWPKGILFGLGLMVIFFILNFFGIRLLAEVNRWLTWWKIIIPALTAVFLFTIVKSSNYSSLSFHSSSGFSPYGTAAIFGAISSTGILFSFLGFRQALDYAGEAKKPQSHVPLATVLSVLIAMVIYVAIQIAFTGAVNWNDIHVILPSGKIGALVHPGDWASLGTSTWASAPLVDAFKAAGVGWLGTWATILVVDAGISPSATGWVYLGTSARTNYGLSVHGNLPKSFQQPNKWHIPWVSLIVATVIGAVFFFPAPSWYELVGFISSATALTYIMGGVGTVVMRRHAGSLHRPVRLPVMWFLAPLGYAAAWMLVYWSGYKTLVQVYGAVFLGLPIFVWYYARVNGWFSTAAKLWGAQIMSLVFLAAWLYIQYQGGWLLRLTPGVNAPWGFWTYYVAQLADVVFFFVGLWLLSRTDVRRNVVSAIWIVVGLFALLPVSYYGVYGPDGVKSQLAAPSILFPWDSLLALVIGIVVFGLAVVSGFRTPELGQIVEASERGAAPAA
ncbi:MAG: APC family permease, partial [Actinomycetota bacterium]|nr:APC family permease [Actinomycetota bacterium]